MDGDGHEVGRDAWSARATPRSFRLPACACALALAACGGSETPPPPDDPVALTDSSNPLGLPSLDAAPPDAGEAEADPELVEPDFNPLGQDAAPQPTSLADALRTEVRSADDYDVWRCEASETGFPVGYAFDTDGAGTFYTYAPLIVEERAPFSYAVTATDAVRMQYPNLEEDITGIRFAGPDAWRGTSSTDGELACARTVISPDTDASGAPAPELRMRLANGYVDNELADSWQCVPPDLDRLVGFAFTPDFVLYSRVEFSENAPVTLSVDYAATGTDSFELSSPSLTPSVRFDSVAFVGPDLFSAVSSLDGELSCGRSPFE